jgi:hypothetical protein
MSVRGRAAALAALLTAVFITTACSSGLFGRKYEYEEDVTLSLDGSATVVVNASIPALAALRGLPLDTDRRARVDRDAIRRAYESPVTRVTRVSPPWTRAGRRFVQIRIETDDIRKLPQAPPFSWSAYQLAPENGRHLFRQVISSSAFRPGTLANVGWNGSEIVAFRLHLPSRILTHNSRSLDEDKPEDVRRGNILGWEQHLSDRLDGKPIEITVEMDSQSILYRTLWLFAGAFVAAMAVLAFLLWLISRKGAKDDPATTTP